MSKAIAQLSGHFTLTVHGGQRGRMVLAEFDNLITNSGLNDIFASTSGTGASRAQLGTGTAAPNATDTALGVAGPATTTIQRSWSVSPTYVAGPPDYSSDYITLRFAAGTATGTWTEVGMTRNVSPFTLFSRALILDGSGNPTSITVLSDESLDVTYTLRVYPPSDDVTGVVNLEGVDYSYILRPARVTYADWGPTQVVAIYGYAGRTTTSDLYMSVFDGAIGARTASTPSGAYVNANAGLTPSAYSNNSYQRTFELKLDLTKGNIAGGIKSLLFNPVSSSGNGGPSYQLEFTPKVPKTSSKILRLNFTAGLARRP